jgi:hypothetical protein
LLAQAHHYFKKYIWSHLKTPSSYFLFVFHQFVNYFNSIII